MKKTLNIIDELCGAADSDQIILHPIKDELFM